MSDAYFGIDLGTGNCSVAYVVDDPRQRNQQIIEVRTVDMPVDDEDRSRSNRVPSVLSVDWRSRAATKPHLFGWEFFNAFSKKRRNAQLLRRGVNYFPSVKSDMGCFKVYPESSLFEGRTPGQITSLILRRIRAIVSTEVSRYPIVKSRVTVSVPASFSSLARQETLDAVVAAGFSRELIELIDEPVAALVDLLNGSDAASTLTSDFKHVLVLDYGAGTCDLSLVRARFDRERANGLEVRNLAISPYLRLGGDDIDRAVMQSVVWQQILGDTPIGEVDPSERRSVEDTLTGTVARGLKERICDAITKHQLGRVARRKWRETYPLKAQFELKSVAVRTPVEFMITGVQFEELMAPFLDPEDPRSIWPPILRTIKDGGLTPGRLDVLLLHGGSSRNPLVQEALRPSSGDVRHTLSSHCVVENTPNVMTSVARGAALASYWRHARGIDFVRPIVAEDLGVVVIGGKGRPLVKAGQGLPYPDEHGVEDVTAGEQQFVVPSGDSPELLVPVYTGAAERPKIAGVVKVPIPPGTPDGAGVRIKLKVSREKTLEWWFSIGDEDFERAASVDDPWTARTDSLEERQLMEHRREMRRVVDAAEVLPLGMQVTEAHLLRQAGVYVDALERVQSLISGHGATAELENLRGLILCESGEDAAAVDAFLKAARADPKEPVYRGNLGCQLADVGRHEEAVAHIRSALAMNPNLGFLYRWLAGIYREAGNEVMAQHELRRALELAEIAVQNRPFHPQEWRSLAGIRFELGDYNGHDSAREQARELERNELFGGDSEAMIAPRFGRTTWRESD